MALWEMVNFLIFVETFIKVAFAAAGTPKDIPFMAFCWSKPIVLKN